ncbi:MAG TPA: hypothetical protein DCP26_04480 [Brevundimonas sp.]|nr:hypothetical protein [Brevundimonas sp.]
MPETMSPREKVFREVLDAVFSGFEHGQCEKEWEAPYGKEIASLATDAILAALASSGDYAELARLAEAANVEKPAKRRTGWFILQNEFHHAARPATVLALIAEVAALRKENDRLGGRVDHLVRLSGEQSLQVMREATRATEAERKLAEARSMLLRWRRHAPTEALEDLTDAWLSKEAERG